MPEKRNTFSGVFVGGSSNTIGGTAAGAGNLVSGNQGDGILVALGTVPSQYNLIQGNYIGIYAVCVDATATPLVYTLSLHDALPICGTVAGARNLISGNTGNGVSIANRPG